MTSWKKFRDIAMPEPVGFHYRLHAYVCGSGKIVTMTSPELVTFASVFGSRPKDSRYAVAQMAPLTVNPDPSGGLFSATEPSGKFLVWDLLDDRLVSGGRTDKDGLVAAPPPIWKGDTAEAAIMWSVMLFGKRE
jgi:hypothetical protein